MRFYSFTNWMLRPIQQGIQPGHAAVELFVKYSGSQSEKDVMLWDWAVNHKTFICLNGGTYADLLDTKVFMENYNNPYPFAAFHEDEASLGSLVTSIGIVLPEKIYITAAAMRSSKDPQFLIELPDGKYAANYVDSEGAVRSYHLTVWEVDLIGRLNSCGLAT
jgi:hypothetical protein